MIQDVNNDALWSLLKERDTLHVVLTYGASCGPCITTKPKYTLVAEFFEKLDPSIKFYQIDIWNAENKVIKEKIEIKAVPTFFLFYNEEIILQEQGSKETLPIRDLIFRGLNEIKQKGEAA
jgi:thiol-disulfide isomerase/thioredoxin